ncbi:MAG: efflux RND transporter periplasmic adaptor subunit [Candidatus Aminicenantes bacterium]|nr:efflux RND transporter periplasmic adaptor subunit [Candidatus Aminicenantes bacterium]
MIKKITLLCLAVSFIFYMILTPGCHRQTTNSDQINAPEIPSQENSSGSSVQKGRQLGTRQAGTTRGYGRRANGRGFNRGAGFSLTEEEKDFVDIETATARYRSIKSTLSAPGKIKAQPQRKAIVSYAFSARVAQIHVQLGDWVQPGQKLITLESEEVGSARSEYYKALADFELAKVNFEREKNLYDRGVGPKKEFLQAESDLKVAEANLEAAEKKLHVLGFTEQQVETISETHQIKPVITLYSPIRGKIIERNAILGAMIDQTTELMIILDPTVLCVDADIYEKDISKVKIGQQVEVTVPAYPEEKFYGTIKYISDVLNEETRTITVRTEVKNKDMKLKAGMFASINITLNHQDQALSIPAECILDDKGEEIVFIKKGDTFLVQVIKTGAKDNGYVEIIQGLTQGDVVVNKGNYQLKSKLYEEILKKGHIH